MEQVLYYNGTIITMENREAPYAEAVLTENGRIKDRGSFSRLREAAGRDARLADLQGAAMIPGLSTRTAILPPARGNLWKRICRRPSHFPILSAL